jgi:hypothetical protein
VKEVRQSFFGLQIKKSTWLLCQKYYCYFGFINIATDFIEKSKPMVVRISKSIYFFCATLLELPFAIHPIIMCDIFDWKFLFIQK